MTTAAIPVSPLLARRLSGSPCVLLLDIDGTLAPIAPRPAEAIVPAETRRVLSALAAMPGVCVVLVSGRAADDARRLGDVAGAWVIGNHGIEVADPDGRVRVRDEILAYESAVSAAAIRAGEIARETAGVVLENKRWTLSVHYRLANEAAVPQLIASIATVAAEFGLRITYGKKVVEVRPPIAVDKGVACVELAASLGGLRERSSVLYAGDDQTDEDAFRALRLEFPATVTVKVGTPAEREADAGGPTTAEFAVHDPSEVLQLLEWMLAARA